MGDMESVYGMHVKATAQCIQGLHAVNTSLQEEILQVRKRALNNSCINRILVESLGNIEKRLDKKEMNAEVLETLVGFVDLLIHTLFHIRRNITFAGY